MIAVHEGAINCFRRAIAEAVKFAHRIVDLPSSASSSEFRMALRRAVRARPARPKQSLGLTSNLMGEMLAACPDKIAGKRDAALISLGYDTLCSCVDSAAMRVEHLAPDSGTILIPRPSPILLARGGSPTSRRARRSVLRTGWRPVASQVDRCSEASIPVNCRDNISKRRRSGGS